MNSRHQKQHNLEARLDSGIAPTVWWKWSGVGHTDLLRRCGSHSRHQRQFSSYLQVPIWSGGTGIECGVFPEWRWHWATACPRSALVSHHSSRIWPSCGSMSLGRQRGLARSHRVAHRGSTRLWFPPANAQGLGLECGGPLGRSQGWSWVWLVVLASWVAADVRRCWNVLDE